MTKRLISAAVCLSAFHWYDANGGQTVETGLTITIGELKDGKYAVTVE